MLKFEKIKLLLEKTEQQHLLQFWDELTLEEKKILVDSIEKIDLEKLYSIIQENLTKSGSKKIKKIEPIPDNCCTVLEEQTKEQIEDWYATGMEAIRKQEVGVIILAGGQGTRLGTTNPKGMYDIGLPSKKSLFQLQAERIKRLEIMNNDSTIPIYVMTSTTTYSKTKEFFKKNAYFSLNPNNIFFFQQNTMPCLEYFDFTF